MDINSKLIDKGIVLADAPPPAANYIPYVKTDKLIFISGQVSQNENGFIKGVLGADLNVEEDMMQQDSALSRYLRNWKMR